MQGNESHTDPQGVFDEIFGNLTEDTSSDVFAELTDATEQSIQKPETAPVEGEGSDPGPEDGNDRYRHWQSKADKAASELRSYKEQVESLSPILRYINESPELASKVFDVVESSLSNSRANGVSGQLGGGATKYVAESQPELKEPLAPEKPSDYDEFQAYNEVGSKSWQYREALQEYKNERILYQATASSRALESKLREVETKLLQSEEEKNYNRAISETYNTLVSEKGMGAEEAKEFIKWARSPEYTMDDLVDLFNVRSGKVKATQIATAPSGPRTVASPLRRPMDMPVPSGSVGSGHDDNRSVEDRIFDSFKSVDAFNNPFTYR